MDSVKEFFQSIYDSYTDRIKNPFIGSFMISFIIFNWRAFAILLYSDWPMHKRIEWIESNYCDVKNLIYPIGISFIYILVLPYFNLFIEFVLKYYTEKKQKKTDDLETARLLKRKENAKILRQIADEKAGTSEIINLQSKIESLQKENNDLVEKNREDTRRLSERQASSNETEKKLNTLIDKLTKDNRILNENLKESIRKFEIERSSKGIKAEELAGTVHYVSSKLLERERHELMDIFGKGKFDIAMEVTEVNFDFFQKLKSLGLATIRNDWGSLTELGKSVLSFTENDYMET